MDKKIAKAYLRYVRIAPRKIQIVCDLKMCIRDRSKASIALSGKLRSVIYRFVSFTQAPVASDSSISAEVWRTGNAPSG